MYRTLLFLTLLFFLIIPCGASDSIDIGAVGDIMMGSNYPDIKLPPQDGVGIFDGVKKDFEGLDILMGNLEGPLVDSGKPNSRKPPQDKVFYLFRTPSRYVKYLKEAGFNVMNVANNHTRDFGFEGLEYTVQILEGAGVHPSGGKLIPILQVKGKKVAVVSFWVYPHPYSFTFNDIENAVQIVHQLKKDNDRVVVTFHGGAEGTAALHIKNAPEYYLNENRGELIKFCHALIDAGADLCIGHGPHVLRAMELYKGKLIAYSLGNFLCYRRINTSGYGGLSIILKAKLDPETGDFLEGEMIPVKLIDHGIPYIDPKQEAAKLIEKLTRQDIANSHLSFAFDSGYSVHLSPQ